MVIQPVPKLRKQQRKKRISLPTTTSELNDDDNGWKTAKRMSTTSGFALLPTNFGGDKNEVELMEPSDVDVLLWRASAGPFVLWLVISALVYATAPPENIVYLDGAERRVAFLAFVVFVIVILVSMIPYAIGFQGKRLSGVVASTFVIQLIALITNGILAWGPTVVFTDPVTKSLAYVTRYCEWTPLAGFMTFLSEAVDLPADRRKMVAPLTTAWLQCISAACGIICPMCPGPVSWGICMTISCITYSAMFFRVARRRKIFDKQCMVGPTAAEMERHERLVFGYKLVLACTVFWTLLVVLYFINMFIHNFYPPDHPIRVPGIAMIVDTIFDVAAKVMFTKLIISVHESVFEQNGHARRRLNEFRHMLSLLWESSSDVIAIAVRGDRGNNVSVMLSPSYSAMVNGTYDSPLAGDQQAMDTKALVLELRDNNHQRSPHAFSDSVIGSDELSSSCLAVKRASLVDADIPLEVDFDEKMIDIAVTEHFVLVAKNIVALMLDSDFHQDGIVLRDFSRSDGSVAKCEIKVSKGANSAVIAIIREISERHLAEAEKRKAMETIARQKDAQAIDRFTRHEVKNGLLASLEICDGMGSSLEEHADGSGSFGGGKNSRVQDLKSALHDVLETVLAESMARNVIQEVYQPKLERLDVLQTLQACRHDASGSERFNVVLRPSNLSHIVSDAQLLKYIHRNAVSNACKYGKHNGTVTTELCHEERTEELVMNVMNLPGTNHDELLAMGEEAEDAVFRQGKRLHSQMEQRDGSTATVSTGDGAWIMEKCAKTLGGTCSIRFHHDKTVFTFRCPWNHSVESNNAPMQRGERRSGHSQDGRMRNRLSS